MGLCICYDRRWSESYRVLASKGAEMFLLGYNTPDQPTDKPGVSHLAIFQNLLCSGWGVSERHLGVGRG